MAGMVEAWLRQAAHDLEHGGAALAAGAGDWACLAAAHAAEKTIKAALLARGGRVLGARNLVLLLDRLRDEAGVAVDEDMVEDARTLMQGPAVLSGQCTYGGIAPFELFTRAQAEGALTAAGRLCARVRLSLHTMNDVKT